ncbi:MAG TPA: geranylgeranylglycerol-phosphate geranylgeranyltransferase [Salinimicrobium sp.]|nr:geranylgeranylglycerol-phosphate geranylgeranyltransferase [Salinimicrobium sp.]
MAAVSNKRILFKILSLFSVVRGYNILIVVIAQYLASLFILAPQHAVSVVLFDPHLFFLVLATASVIASGYIINNFYDSEKDLINRPQKTLLDRYLSQQTKLFLYFFLNFASVVFASYISFRAVLFVSAYIFLIWFYSHRLKRILFLGNLVASILTILPFFAVFLYYKNFESVIFVHAAFLYIIIVIRELVKDLENMKGDMLQGYKTIPVVFGEKSSKAIISILIVLTLIPVYFLIWKFDIGFMDYYFYLAVSLLFVLFLFLYFSKTKPHYLVLHNILKFIIVAGVFSILLIDTDLLLARIL